MIVLIVAALATLVLAGSLFVVYGARQGSWPTRTLTIAFALTAASWLAFLIAAIGATVILLALPKV